MFVVAVTIFVKPEFVEPFMAATLANARGTRGEPGNVRFDVLRAAADPTRFMLYEAYHSQDGFVAHQQTAHYQTWRQTVADWMAEPRVGVKHTSVFFGDGEA